MLEVMWARSGSSLASALDIFFIAGEALQLMAPLLLQQHEASCPPDRHRISYAVIAAANAATSSSTASAPIQPLHVHIGAQLAEALPGLLSWQLSLASSTLQPGSAAADGSMAVQPPQLPAGTFELLQHFPELLEAVLRQLGGPSAAAQGMDLQVSSDHPSLQAGGCVCATYVQRLL